MSNNHNRVPQPPTNRDPRSAEGRDLDTRETAAREQTWLPPDLLPEPIKMPGFVYRYIRTASMGEDDPMNVNRQFREGYSPVPAEEQPHMVMYNDTRAKNKGCIEVGGLLLCKAPESMIKQREKHYHGMAQQAQRSVDNHLMSEQDARMPLSIERKSKITFGGG